MQLATQYDHLVIEDVGSRHAPLAIGYHKDGRLMASTGCFYGSVDEFLNRVEKTHHDNEHAQAYRKIIEFAKTFLTRDEARNGN
jgi:hypothetical protein